MKCLTEPDLLPSGFPLLPPDLSLLSSVGAGRRRVYGGGEREGRRREGGAKERGRPNRLMAEAATVASWE